MKRGLATATLVSGAFVAGMFAGRWSAPKGEVSAPCPTASQVITRTTITPGGDCGQELEAAKALLKAQHALNNGTPVAFPEDLPADYTPAGFEANVHRAVAECPGMPFRLEFVDCTEYPCLVWFEQAGSTQTSGHLSCPFWDDRYPNRVVASSSGTLRVGDTDRAYFGLGEWPESGGRVADHENQSTRLMLRFEEGRTRLMDAWGGRELTERESLERMIAYFDAAAADGSPGAADMAASMRKELDALPDDE